MKANIYKALSNKSELTKITAGHTLAQEFDGIDLENSIFIVNGHKVNADYIIKDGDLVTVRVLPSAVTTSALIGTAIFLGAAALIGGIALGVSLYEANKKQGELEKMLKISNRPSIDNRPFLRGASNTLATGNSQPYMIGHCFFTPYLHNTPVYTLEGEDGKEQYTWRVLELGFNKQNIKKIGLGNTVVKRFAGDEAQQGTFSLDAGQIFAEGSGEITQDGSLLKELTLLNYRHVTTMHNAEIARDTEIDKGDKVAFTTPLNMHAKDVDIAISFTQGLYTFNEDGDKIATKLTVTPQYSLNGGQTWNDFTFNINGTQTNVIEANKQKELRYIAHKDFTLADYQALTAPEILVRVRSNGAKDNKIINSCYVLYTQSLIFDPLKSSTPAGVLNDNGAAGLVNCLIVEDRERKFCTILGLKIKATKINETVSDKVNVVTNGLARVWDGTAWSKDKRPTSNPAAWLLECLTSDTHPASRYSDDEIDLQSIGELFEHCESRGYTYNQVITQNTRKADTLANIVKVCDAVLYRDIYGRMAVAIDRPQAHALAVYNSQNILSISNNKDFTRKADGVRIKYIEMENDAAQEQTYLLMREENGKPVEITADSIIRDIQLTGVTDFSHVVKYARRLMALEVLRPKTTTIEVGSEGIYYTPFSKVLIQDNSLKVGLANGLVQSVKYTRGKVDTITLDASVYFEEGKTYGLIVNAWSEDGCVPLNLKIRGTGNTATVKVVTDVYETDTLRPEKNNVFSFGELGVDDDFIRVATPYLINGIKRSGSRYALELVNYDEALYDTGAIPAYKPNITEKPDPVPQLPELPPLDVLKGEPGKQGITLLIEKPALLYYATPEGLVNAQETTSKIRFIQGDINLPINIGAIESPAGFDVYAVGNTVHIRALDGTSMARDGVIKVPIIYRPILLSTFYTDGNGNIYTDSDEAQYGSLTFSEKSYNYNVYISYAKSIKGNKGEKGTTGAQGDRGARYWGTEKPADPVTFDFYLEKTTCLLKQWDGKEWKIVPESDPLYLQAIEDIIDNVDPVDPAQKDILAKANVYALKLCSKTILASEIFTKELVLTAPKDASGQPTGKVASIKSSNYEAGAAGFYLDSNGKFEAQDAVIRGKIFADTGTFEGSIQANGLIFKIQAGDIFLARLNCTVSYSADIAKNTDVLTSVGRGSMKAKVKGSSDMWSGSSTKYSILKNKTPIYTYTVNYPNVYEDTFIINNLEVGDVIEIETTGTMQGRAGGWGMDLDLYTSYENPVFKQLCNIHKEKRK